jgi:type I restriction enzyme S subunit
MFILMSPEYQKTFDRLKVGTSDSSVSIGNQQVLELELIVPPVVEQEKIVEILEEQFSRLNAALDSINIMKSKIEQLQGSLTEAAMDGNSLTEFAGDWEVKLLGDLVNHKSDIVDGPFGSNLKSEHYVGAGARVVRLQNIGYGDFRNEKAFITEEHFERLKKHNVVGGDLLFASLGERLPRTCLMPDLDAPAIVKADCIRIRLSPGVNNRFILYATQSPTARVWASEQLHGLGRPRLGLGNIRAFPVRIPSLEVQDRIVNFLDEQFSRLDASLAVAEAIEKKSSALRRSLLHAAFTGELTKEWREGAHV